MELSDTITLSFYRAKLLYSHTVDDKNPRPCSAWWFNGFWWCQLSSMSKLTWARMRMGKLVASFPLVGLVRPGSVCAREAPLNGVNSNARWFSNKPRSFLCLRLNVELVTKAISRRPTRCRMELKQKGRLGRKEACHWWRVEALGRGGRGGWGLLFWKTILCCYNSSALIISQWSLSP